MTKSVSYIINIKMCSLRLLVNDLHGAVVHKLKLTTICKKFNYFEDKIRSEIISSPGFTRSPTTYCKMSGKYEIYLYSGISLHNIQV